jgi:hypothetical protein
MLITVIALNVLIALGCLWVAARLWRIRCILRCAADELIDAERKTHLVLQGAPEAIQQGQLGIYTLRQQLVGLAPTFQQAQQAIALLTYSAALWQRAQRQPK